MDRDFKLEFPPNPDLGDLASTIAFALTKKLRTSPPEVAKGLVEKIEVPEIFSKVQNFGPYVNFFIDYTKFSKLLFSLLKLSLFIFYPFPLFFYYFILTYFSYICTFQTNTIITYNLYKNCRLLIIVFLQEVF